MQSFSDTETTTKKDNHEFEKELKCSSSLPDLSTAAARNLKKRFASKIRRRLVREFYSSKDPEQLKQLLYGKSPSDKTRESILKIGRLLLIGMAVFSIPMDSWKMFEGVRDAHKTLDGPSSLEYLEFYSCDLTTNIVGLTAAVNHQLALTLFMRLLSTSLLQSSFNKKGDGQIPPPADSKEFQEYIKKKVPPHRLPKGMKYSDFGGSKSKRMDPEREFMKGRRTGKKKKKLGKKKLGKKKTGKKNTKTQKSPVKSKSKKKAKKKTTKKSKSKTSSGNKN